MIVENNGYLTLADVLKLDCFSIYETTKKTHILVINPEEGLNGYFYFPKRDRQDYKLVEGKKITSGLRVFNSKTQPLSEIDITKWNGGKQIMSYEIRSF